jgi:hypothetical protein
VLHVGTGSSGSSGIRCKWPEWEDMGGSAWSGRKQVEADRVGGSE